MRFQIWPAVSRFFFYHFGFFFLITLLGFFTDRDERKFPSLIV